MPTKSGDRPLLRDCARNGRVRLEQAPRRVCIGHPATLTNRVLEAMLYSSRRTTA
jgi:hypothetical protein